MSDVLRAMIKNFLNGDTSGLIPAEAIRKTDEINITTYRSKVKKLVNEIKLTDKELSDFIKSAIERLSELPDSQKTDKIDLLLIIRDIGEHLRCASYIHSYIIYDILI